MRNRRRRRVRTKRAVKGGRDNPLYDPDHCFTVTQCDECGEFYEADKPHVCRRRNSWPFQADDEKGDES